VDDSQNTKAGGKRDLRNHEALTTLSSMIAAARIRAGGLHSRAATESGDVFWIAEALQEVDTAHEELRVAEDELRAQADGLVALQAAFDFERHRYRELFLDAPEAYLTTDVYGSVVEANRRASQILAISGRAIVGKPLSVFVSDGDRRAYRDAIATAAECDTTVRFELSLASARAAEPLRVTASLRRSLDRESASVQLRWIFYVHDDASPREHLPAARPSTNAPTATGGGMQPELPTANESAEHSRAVGDRALKQLEGSLAIVTHELRNPLSAIKGWLELLADSESVTRLRERALIVLKRNVETMSRMLDQLMDASSNSTAVLSLDLREVAITDVINRSIESSHPAASLASVQLVTRLEPQLSSVRADPTRLEQVLMNLIGNAIKFTPKDGVVEIHASAQEDLVTIEVRDTGYGIQSENLERIFQPFVRLDGRGPRVSGLGLGLSISRQLIELHGGQLTATSGGAGMGTTFQIRLPRSLPRSTH
jgi:signal transduction histidine kinase